MNLLTTPLPYAVKVGGREVPINTSFRVGMRFELLALDDQLTPENVLTTFFGDNWPQPYDEAVKQALWFYCLGKPHEKEETDKQNLKPSRRSYDFEIDADALYTSFREAYGIDLLQEDLHWWAFRELMLGLPDDTPFKQRVYYRTGSTEGMSAKQKKQFETRRAKYAIPERGAVDHKLTLSERDAAIKRYENLQAPLRDTVQFATELVGQLSEALNENGLEGLVSAAGDVLSEVLLKITSELPKFIDIGVKVIKSLISGLLKNKKTLVDSAIEIGKGLVSGLGSILGDLTLAALEIITTLADSLAKEAPTLIPAAVEAVLQFVEGLLSTENISALIDAALALLTGLVEGLIAAVPIIIEAAPIIIENLVTAILDNLPQIIECAITLLNALTQGLLDNLPLLVDAAIELTLAIAEGLIEALPDLIDAALDLVGALVDTIFATDWLALGAKILESLVKGILSLIGSLFEAAGKIVSTIWDKITNTEWFQKGAEVLTKIINGIKSIFTNLAQTASDLVKKITDKIMNTEWFQKGSEILTKIIDGIKSLFSNLGQAASDLVSQVWDTITNTNWLDLGRNIIEGIANGVSNAVGTLVQAAKNVANSALNAIKSALGIASPSKVFAKEVGRWIPPGIGKGVDQAMPELTDDMRAQLQDLIDDANVSVATEVGGLSSKLALTANSGSGGGNHSQTITNDNGIIVYVTYNGDGSEEDARRVGKQIGAETAREIRRRGLAPT